MGDAPGQGESDSGGLPVEGGSPSVFNLEDFRCDCDGCDKLVGVRAVRWIQGAMRGLAKTHPEYRQLRRDVDAMLAGYRKRAKRPAYHNDACKHRAHRRRHGAGTPERRQRQLAGLDRKYAYRSTGQIRGNLKRADLINDDPAADPGTDYMRFSQHPDSKALNRFEGFPKDELMFGSPDSLGMWLLRFPAKFRGLVVRRLYGRVELPESKPVPSDLYDEIKFWGELGIASGRWFSAYGTTQRDAYGVMTPQHRQQLDALHGKSWRTIDHEEFQVRNQIRLRQLPEKLRSRPKEDLLPYPKVPKSFECAECAGAIRLASLDHECRALNVAEHTLGGGKDPQELEEPMIVELQQQVLTLAVIADHHDRELIETKRELHEERARREALEAMELQALLAEESEQVEDETS